jgi:hypothetical protein
MSKSVAFLYSNNVCAEREIREMILKSDCTETNIDYVQGIICIFYKLNCFMISLHAIPSSIWGKLTFLKTYNI